MNIYSDFSHTALKYLKDTEVNIENVLLMTGNFNIRDSLWDSVFPFHSSVSDNLIIIADSFNLSLSTPTNPCPTRYSDTAGESNSVIDLIFLHCGSYELDHHSIHPGNCLSLDHAPLSIKIPIIEKVIQSSKLMIHPKSNQETVFVEEVISSLKNLDTSVINDFDKLESIVNQLGTIIDQAWIKNAKKSRMSKHSKQWWIDDCSRSLNIYRASRSLENWKNFKKVVKNVKRSFFDEKIQEVANKRKGPWELMNLINRYKLPATKAIKHNGSPCLFPESLWNTLHNTFNTALHCQVDLDILNEIDCKPTSQWFSFSKEEFKQAISKCNNLSAPGPDKLSWHHLKFIINQDECLANIINIANACFNLGHWPNYFKYSP